MAGDILTKVDRMSMATSLEVRAPLLDHVFAEWVTQLPDDPEIAGRTTEIHPEEACRAPRRAGAAESSSEARFWDPLGAVVPGGIEAGSARYPVGTRTAQRGYFDAAAVRQLVDEHHSGRRDRSSDLWILLVFELWHRNFLEKRQPQIDAATRPIWLRPFAGSITDKSNAAASSIHTAEAPRA